MDKAARLKAKREKRDIDEKSDPNMTFTPNLNWKLKKGQIAASVIKEENNEDLGLFDDVLPKVELEDEKIF